MAALGWKKLRDDQASASHNDQITISYTFSCPLDMHHRTDPAIVSIVAGNDTCKRANNALTVRNAPWKSKYQAEVAVCLKALEMPFEDLSLRLIEWLEALKALGAAGVFVYLMKVHENVAKTFKYYHQTGFVTVTHLPLPGNQVSIPTNMNRHI